VFINCLSILQQQKPGCSADYEQVATTEGGDCLKTIIPVTLYYDGDDTSGFEQKVVDAINDHSWNVPGLMQVSAVETDDSVVAGVEGQQVAADDDSMAAGGYLAIAGACLVALLAAVMLMRRNRREEEIKHIELGDDGETYLRDMDSQGSPDPLAGVVGEDGDSAMDGYFGNIDSHPAHQDVHHCSSALCEVCEQSRRAGVQFIPSATMAHAPTPPDQPREYTSDDTVAL